MMPAGKFRVGIVALTAALTVGIAWGLTRRANSGTRLAAVATATAPVSPPPEILPAATSASAVVDDSFPAPNNSATDDELLALARTYVARSPQRAIAWAQSQRDPLLQRRLLCAVLHAWGERDPASAVDWALAQDDSVRQSELDAALAGAVKQPQVAVAIVRRLMADYPDNGAAFGGALIVALSNAGEFETALEFLTNAPSDLRDGWLAAIFQRWGASQPQDAIQKLNSIADGKLRSAALQAVMAGWAGNDPAGLAAFSISLPAGPDRDGGLKLALDNWSLQDPAAMAAWLNTLPPGNDFDQGVTMMLAKTDAANLNTETALQWVQSVSDPALRFDSLATVVTQWAQTDAAAAINFVNNSALLSDQQRSTLLQKISAAQ